MSPPRPPRRCRGALLLFATASFAACVPSSAFVATAPGRASRGPPPAGGARQPRQRPPLAALSLPTARRSSGLHSASSTRPLPSSSSPPRGAGHHRLRSSASDVSEGSSSSSSPDAPSDAESEEVETTAPPPTKSAAVLEAERLRARARLLKSEAATEEAALRASSLAKKASLNADYDATISRLTRVRESIPPISGDDTAVVKKFEATMVGEVLPRWVKDREAGRVGRQRRGEALASWMRDERVTTNKLIKVVERIYEREKIARNGRTAVEAAMADVKDNDKGEKAPPDDAVSGADDVASEGAATGTPPPSSLGVAPASVAMPPPGAGLTFQIGAASNVASNNEAELSTLAGLVDEIVDACDLLDEERRPKGKGGEKGASSDEEAGEGATVADANADNEGAGAVVAEERHYGLSSNSANVLRSRIKDLRRADDENFKRRLASEIHAADRKLKVNGKGPRKVLKGELKEGETIEDFVRRTMAEAGDNGTSVEVELRNGLDIDGDFNVTRFVMDVMRVPLWVPSSLLPFVVTCPDDLDQDDAKRIKAEVLRGSTFACSGWDCFERAAIYRGDFVGRRMARTVAAMEGGKAKAKKGGTTDAAGATLGKKSGDADDDSNERPLSEEVFAEIQSRLQDAGLADRIQLFLTPDPEWRPGELAESGPPPVILAVPKSLCPEQGDERGKGVKFLTAFSVLSTLVTTFAYGVAAFALNPTFYDAIIKDADESVLWSCVPIFLGVLALQAVHELGHYVVAKQKDVKMGWPVPLPSLQIGTFGSITPLRSFPETRTDMMDVALAGPGLTLVVSIALMVAGIGMTIGSSEEVLATLPVVPSALLRSSFLAGSLTSVLAPKVAGLPLSQPIPIHPLFMIGLTGLVSSALNLLPIGRLDGGRAFSAAFGRRPAVLVSFFFLLIMAIAALSQRSQVSIFWGLLVTVFQRNGDVPTRDEVTGVDVTRRGLYGALTAVALLALLPFPGGPGAL